jgi:mRNA interferase MazF
VILPWAQKFKRNAQRLWLVPITDWSDKFTGTIWHVKINPDKVNGLTKPSAVDALQVRSMDTSRFIHKMGCVSANELEEIIAAIAAVIEY